MSTANTLEQNGTKPSERPSTIISVHSVLAIGSCHFFKEFMVRFDGRSVIWTDRRLLSHACFAAVQPDVIVAPLIGQGWDLFDLGSFLQDCTFHGQLFALTQPLPAINIIVQEIFELLPTLKISVVEMAERGHITHEVRQQTPKPLC